MDESDIAIERALLETIDNQMRDGTPPEVQETYARLISEGISESDARLYLAEALSYEMYAMKSEARTYSHANYAALLAQLPNLDHLDE